MTAVRKLRMRNRLGALILDGSGVSFSKAVQGAEEALAAMRGGLLVSLKEIVETLVVDFGPRATSREQAAFIEVYNRVLNVIDLAGAVPGAGIDQAAHGLCDVIDRCAMADRWDWPAVDVHLASLQLLIASPDMPEAARRNILDGLAKVARKTAAD